MKLLAGATIRADRKSVLMKAAVISAEGVIDARVRNLSRSGAALVCARDIAVGQDVIFSRGNVFAAAKVVRRDNGGLAVEFYTPLQPEAVNSFARGSSVSLRPEL